jgi:hypothetical protein
VGFAVGGSGGLSLLSTRGARELPYDPVIGAFREQDPAVLYQLLPDVYQILADRDLLPQIWRGFLQIAADLYLSLMSADASQYLMEVPLDYQRKYAHLQLDHLRDLEAPVEDLQFAGLGKEQGIYSPVLSAYVFRSRSRYGFDALYLPLISEVDERARLRWSVDLTVSSWEESSLVLFGYFRETGIGSSLLVGVGYEGSLLLLNASEGEVPNLRKSPPGLVPLGERVTISAEYAGGTIRALVRGSEGEIFGSFDFLLEDGDYPARFVADVFGVTGLDLRLPSTDLRGIPSREIEVFLRALSYMDPSLGETYQAVPFLQDEWDHPTFLWSEGREFHLQSTERGQFLTFDQNPPDHVLAEYVSHDLNLVEDHFGRDVGIAGENTEIYRDQVRALHYAFWKGPTIASVRLGIQVLLGLPFSAEAREVKSINASYSGDRGEILIRGKDDLRSYLYPLTVTPTVSVGEVLPAFSPLTNGVEVLDWKNSPKWFLPFLGDSSLLGSTSAFREAAGLIADDPIPSNEIKKFHTFAVEMLAELIPSQGFLSVQSFVSAIKQTWKSFILLVRKDLSDDMDIDDPVGLEAALTIWDRGGGGTELVAPYYGSPGDPPYDYQYGQETDPPLKYGMFEVFFPRDPIEVTILNQGGSPVTFLLGGNSVTVEPLGVVVEEIP